METETLYERIGGDSAVRKLTDRFYDLVFEHELIARLFKTDKETIREKQRLFLTQFLGGPQLYSEIHGHPMMRARHMPHPITEDDAVAWLQCMAQAVGSLDLDPELKDELFNRFPRTAFFMVNCETDV
ncbi:Group 2 truncated hemoglobin YjbI [Dyadobacter sp. CECT 9275]|uniref:Group 2 truncated hemoglobin YjbI n=1 Tax=Dyadobacter helix TaxID=2822344 RepID=A0A916JA73_9BACT|nr:globin [Dyadobacter sp. CECT 9275]CAG4994475.1 Group 2 truncated hemoglobin YjbI [Dyadobacter sp. CECT 9275]